MSRRNKGPQLPTPDQNQMQANIDVSTAPNVFCEKCGNFAFVEVMTFKHLSAILSPNGREGLVPVPTFMCSSCGYIPPKMMPVPLVFPDGEEGDVNEARAPEEGKSGIIVTDI